MFVLHEHSNSLELIYRDLIDCTLNDCLLLDDDNAIIVDNYGTIYNIHFNSNNNSFINNSKSDTMESVTSNVVVYKTKQVITRIRFGSFSFINKQRSEKTIVYTTTTGSIGILLHINDINLIFL